MRFILVVLATIMKNFQNTLRIKLFIYLLFNVTYSERPFLCAGHVNFKVWPVFCQPNADFIGNTIQKDTLEINLSKYESFS